MSNEESIEIVPHNNEIEMLKSGISEAMVSTIFGLDSQVKFKNVAIFVDYDNVYWTLMKNYQHDPDHEDPSKNLFHQLWANYGHDNIRSFRAYADFEKIRTQLTSLQKQRIQIRHVYSNGKDDNNRKNSSDIELCIDAIESTYKEEKISCYVIVTADSDMIPLLSRLMYKGKRVELYYLSNAAAKHTDITSYADYSCDLLDFLNVDILEFDLNKYIIDALLKVQAWWNLNEKTDFFLGKRWLNTELQKMGLPEIYVSELLEKLQIDEFLHEVNKETSSGVKKSIALTDKGIALLAEAQAEAAATKET